jgi:hypothetical protein
MSCTNLKQAAELLAYHVGQQKELAHQQQMQLVQQQSEGNMQASQALEAAKQDTLVIQGEIDLQKIAAQAQADYYLEMMKKGADVHSAEIQAQGRNIAMMIQAHAKIESTKITAKNRPKKAS